MGNNMNNPELPKIDSNNQSKGLGDTIKKITNALNIPQCGACKQRQQKLNRLFPYKPKPNNKK